MNHVIFISLLILNTSAAFSQHRRLIRQNFTTHLLLSSSTFLSDLGGKDADGSNDPTDIDFRKTRYALGSGIQYNWSSGFAIGADLFYTRLTASDEETDWNRKYRNISVRTDVVETSFKIEYTLPKKLKAFGGLYFNIGGGIAFYQPMGKFNGSWYKLREFGTEGQLVDPTQKKYSTVTPVIPFGFGKKFDLENGLILSLDLSLRKTFTDYLDDVSTVYYDPTAIQASSGEAAAYFSNPSLTNPVDGRPIGSPGSIRGNSTNNDNYFLVGFKLALPLNKMKRKSKNKYPKVKSWISTNGSIPKMRKDGRKKRVRLFR